MRMIAGLELPTEGRIYIDNKLVNDLEPRDRDVAMVFQNYALYPHMTVYNNISFPLQMRKYPKDEIQLRVDKTSELLQITDLMARKPRELSGGQQQRVALGRALVREPKVFLMDEPLSNLDAKLRGYMRAEMKNLQKRIGITTIYVTHDQVEALTMSDRIALMNSGHLEQLGTPEEVYNEPASLFVAGFVGSPPMNFVRCKLDASEHMLRADGFVIDMSGNMRAPSEVGSCVTVGIRPEDLSVSTSQTPGSIEGELYIVEPMGSETIVNVKIGKDIIKVKASSWLEKTPGTSVWVRPDTSKLHIFSDNERAVLIT